ncbi:DUF3293 domain-containing protein [Rhodobacter flavimaris]|nr:DUF3293 domain-containing protein [Sinirhodobacter sp. WL0062]
MSEPPCVAQVGVCDDRIDKLLRNHGATTGEVLTAWNPESQLCSLAENDAVQRRLEVKLEAMKVQYLDAEGRRRDGTCRAERSFCCLGLSLDTAFELARAFGQSAFLCFEIGKPPFIALTR